MGKNPNEGPEHPAPWRWGTDGDDWLRAANNEIVIDAGDGCTWPANAYVGELVRAAPEMEALLREDPTTEGMPSGVVMCVSCTKEADSCEDDCWGARVRALIAHIDAAKGGG